MSGRRTVVRVTGLPAVDVAAAEALLRSKISENLQEEERQSLSYRVTMVPSCAARDARLVALLDFKGELPVFLSGFSQDRFRERQLELEEPSAVISFDVHFQGFTQLYPIKATEGPNLDIIAIPGLDGHAYGSWQSRADAQEMWLRHWLSEDMPNCRTMIYGYKSRLSGIGKRTIEDYAIELMDWVGIIRDSPETQRRPLIFVAHSLGGLILARMIVKAKQASDGNDLAIASLYRATYAVIFFAVPHRGLDVEDMKNIINATGGQMGQLVEQIENNSQQLITQQIDFKDALEDRPIVSLYETEQSRRLVKDEEGQWRRTGNTYTPFEKDNAILQLPRQMEARIPVDADHSSIAKFSNISSSKYASVLRHLRHFQRDAPDNVKSRFSEPQMRMEPTAINLIAQDRDFVDRPEIFERLEAALARSKMHSRAALRGLGGIGKSQIAIEYGHRFRRARKDAWVFWIYASSAATVTRSFGDIAKALEISGFDDPKKDTLDLVSRWLADERNGPWLVVVDNADDKAVMQFRHVHGATASDEAIQAGRQLRDYIPQCAHGQVLVTSRNREAANDLVGNYRSIIEVEVMSTGESIALLRARTDIDSDERESAEQLVVALNNIPLAVSQAGAYIEQQKSLISVSGYLEEFQNSTSEKQSLLSVNHNELRRDPDVPNSVIATWEITFRQLQRQQPDAADLLALLAMYHHQNIPGELLPSKTAADNSALRQRLVLLEGFALIVMTGKNCTNMRYSMHSLVQLATRVWLDTESRTKEHAQLAIELINAALPQSDYDYWATCDLIMPHAIAVTERTELDFPFGKQKAGIICKLGGHFDSVGLFEQAVIYARRALETCQEIRVVESDDLYLLCSTNLGSTYISQGQLDKAETLYVKALERMRATFEDNPNMLAIMHNLAIIYYEQGRLAEAETLAVHVLKRIKEELGEDDPSTLLTMSTLAATHHLQGRFAEAEALMVHVLERRKAKLREHHPLIQMSMNNLASLYSKQRRLSEAEALQIQVVELGKAELGDDHPDTVTGINNLACTYRLQGRLVEAEALVVQVLERSKATPREDYPLTLVSKRNLASIYYDQGRLAEAETLQMQLIEQNKAKLGDDHRETLLSMSDLAATYCKQGRLDESEALYVQIIERRKATLKENHQDTLLSMSDLATAYWDQGRLDEAEMLEVQVMKGMKATLGEDHPLTLLSLSNLAVNYRQQGRLDEAESLQVQLIERRKVKLGEDHPDTLGSMANLAIIFFDLQKNATAVPLMEKAVSRLTIRLGETHPKTKNYRDILEKWHQ